MDSEGRAYDRSEPGTGPTPVYNGPSIAAINQWRVNTPPIVESPDETYEEVIAKQAGKR